MSSWRGKGHESEAEINLTPVTVEAPKVKEAKALTKTKDVKSETSNTSFEMPNHLDDKEVLQADSEQPISLDGPGGCVD